MESVSTPAMNFSMGEDGIIRAGSRPGVEATPELMLEAEAACRVLRKGVRRPAIWDIAGADAPQPKAWIQFLERAPDNLLAIAIVGTPEQLALLGSFPGMMGRFLLPVKVFTHPAEAEEWVKEYAAE